MFFNKNKKKAYVPLWGHFVCCGLDTIYDKNDKSIITYFYNIFYHYYNYNYMTITDFLNSKGFSSFEGNCSWCPEQVSDLIELTNKPNLKVMEIGFNAGHSAEVFLKNNETLTLTSFDLGYHKYISASKEYIDSNYPKRHTLILGDSTITIP
jgi:hypothetical protein